MKPWNIFIGFDAREADAYEVCRLSILRHLSESIPVHALVLDDMRARGLYWRKHERLPGPKGDVTFDVISGAPMSTEFAISRFLVPTIAKTGLALFLDCDMLVRDDLAKVFRTFDKRWAAACVKHPNYQPAQSVKMDGQLQTFYARKNWTSFILFNCDHPANAALTLERINTRPGRELHALDWIPDDQIGALAPAYNHLVGEVPHDPDAKVIHWTRGGPWMVGYENEPFADEWFRYRRQTQRAIA